MIPPLITPLTPVRALDRDALHRLVDHVIEHRVDAIFLLGSTGEWASLAPVLRGEVLKEGIRATEGRIPVLVNISANSLAEVRQSSEHAVLAGADAGVLAMPFYYGLNQEEARRYVEEIAETSPLPLVLYNAPQFSGTSIATETFRILVTHEIIIVIKDSSGDLKSMQAIRSEVADRDASLMAGPDRVLMSAMRMGFDGGVCGGSNLFPGLYAAFIRAFREGDQKKTTEFQLLIRKIDQEVFRVTDSPLGFVIGLKYAMSVRGLCTGTMALPVHSPLKKRQKSAIAQLVREMTEKGY
jgi:4-hydroxy-tetrahydrodipicolinate synthase